MTKKKLLDLLPFAGLCVSLIVALIIMVMSEHVIQWQHYLAALFLTCNGILFYNSHKKGVLFCGLVVVLGIIGVLAFQVGLVGASVYWTPGDLRIPVFAGNPILLIVFIVHLVLSGRFYVGIATKRYWQNLRNENYLDPTAE